MQHKIHPFAGGKHGIEVSDVGLAKIEFIQDVSNVFATTMRQVVQTAHLIPARDQEMYDVGANESPGSCNKIFGHSHQNNSYQPPAASLTPRFPALIASVLQLPQPPQYPPHLLRRYRKPSGNTLHFSSLFFPDARDDQLCELFRHLLKGFVSGHTLCPCP